MPAVRQPARAPRAIFVAEPPALWNAKPPLVVDCNVLVAHLFEEDDAVEAGNTLKGCSLHAPSLLTFEFANVACTKSRSGGPEQRIAGALLAFSELRIELHIAPASDLHRLAVAYELTAYDAAYLWLAGEMRAPLATFDKRLLKAAQQYLRTLE